MLVSSLSHVPKVPCSVVICVDCRPTITKGCLVWSLKAVKAMSLTILALMKRGADITLTTLGEDKLMKQLPLNPGRQAGESEGASDRPCSAHEVG